MENNAESLTLTVTVRRADGPGDVSYRIEHDGEVKEGAIRASAAKGEVLEAVMYIVACAAADDMAAELMSALEAEGDARRAGRAADRHRHPLNRLYNQ